MRIKREWPKVVQMQIGHKIMLNGIGEAYLNHRHIPGVDLDTLYNAVLSKAEIMDLLAYLNRMIPVAPFMVRFAPTKTKRSFAYFQFTPIRKMVFKNGVLSRVAGSVAHEFTHAVGVDNHGEQFEAQMWAVATFTHKWLREHKGEGK